VHEVIPAVIPTGYFLQAIHTNRSAGCMQIVCLYATYAKCMLVFKLHVCMQITRLYIKRNHWLAGRKSKINNIFLWKHRKM